MEWEYVVNVLRKEVQTFWLKETEFMMVWEAAGANFVDSNTLCGLFLYSALHFVGYDNRLQCICVCVCVCMSTYLCTNTLEEDREREPIKTSLGLNIQLRVRVKPRKICEWCLCDTHISPHLLSLPFLWAKIWHFFVANGHFINSFIAFVLP